MTPREIKAVSEAIYNDLRNQVCLSMVLPSNCNSAAQAAIAASDSKYIKGLVEALKEITNEEYKIEPAKPAWGIATLALYKLPEDLVWTD
jgi:hypothetical protein